MKRAPGQPTEPDDTEVVFGVRAGLGVFEARRAAIVRVAYSREVRAMLGDLERWCVGERIPMTEAPGDRLARLSGSSHHEGLCVLARKRPWTTPPQLAAELVASAGVAVALDRVRNPYNIGAMVRSAAFFGVRGVVLGAPAPHPGLPPDAVRVAEGGAEHVMLCRTTDLADTVSRMRTRGIQIVGASGESNVSAIGYPFVRPAVLVIGNEREGLSPRVRERCDAVIAIRGTGAVESLNAGVAAGVLLAELTRVVATKGA